MNRRTLAIAAAPLALAAIAAPAYSNVTLNPTCELVTLTGFRPSALPLADVTIRSDAGLHRSGPYAGPGWTIPVPAGASGAVIASASDGRETWTSDACLIAVPPQPAPSPATPTAPQGPGAGEPRVEPMPRKEAKPTRKRPAKSKPRAPRVGTTPARRCPPEKAGRMWHVKARAKWGCAMPPRFRVVRSRVGVTG